MEDFLSKAIRSGLKDSAFVSLFGMEDVGEDEKEERDGPIGQKGIKEIDEHVRKTVRFSNSLILNIIKFAVIMSYLQAKIFHF